MKNNYQIRSLELKDWTQFRLLRLEALQQHPEAFGASLEEECLLTDEMFREGYSKSEIFGAFSKDNETLVGCAGFFYILIFKNATSRLFIFDVHKRRLQKPRDC